MPSSLLDRSKLTKSSSLSIRSASDDTWDRKEDAIEEAASQKCIGAVGDLSIMFLLMPQWVLSFSLLSLLGMVVSCGSIIC
eukprot:scaffold5882_cov100-Cylindrotheca_fusiformis.AAC.6